MSILNLTDTKENIPWITVCASIICHDFSSWESNSDFYSHHKVCNTLNFDESIQFIISLCQNVLAKRTSGQS